MATWKALVRSSLVEINAASNDESVSDAELTLLLPRLQQMLESWNLSEFLRFGYIRHRHSVVVAKREYSIGEANTNDIEIAVPDRINEVIYTPSGGYKYPLEAINLRRQLRYEVVEGVNPRQYYYENSYPSASIRFDHEARVGDSFLVVAREPLDYAVMLNEEVDLPNGYERAIVANFAMEIAPQHGVNEIHPVTVRNAREGLDMIKTRNSEKPLSRFDDLCQMSGGYRRGYYGYRRY